jgi:hypothetical protein
MRYKPPWASPGRRSDGGRRRVVPRQRAVEGHGVLKICEAERAEAPGVLRRVAGGLVFLDGARARGAHGLDEAVLEPSTWVTPSAALSPERRFFFGFSAEAPSVRSEDVHVSLGRQKVDCAAAESD